MLQNVPSLTPPPSICSVLNVLCTAMIATIICIVNIGLFRSFIRRWFRNTRCFLLFFWSSLSFQFLHPSLLMILTKNICSPIFNPPISNCLVPLFYYACPRRTPYMKRGIALFIITLNAGTRLVPAQLTFNSEKFLWKLPSEFLCVFSFNQLSICVFYILYIKPNVLEVVDTNYVIPLSVLDLHYCAG